MALKNEEILIEAKNFFNFYKKNLAEALRSNEKVIYISFKDLSEFSSEISELLLDKPEEIITLLEMALTELGLIKNARIRLLDLPEDNNVKIRNIRAKHLNRFIWVEGIVRQASDVRPQVVSAKFECPSCGTIISVLQLEKKFKEPSRCSCGRKGFFKLVSKQMVDAQRLVIEESPEALIGGEQPRRMNVFLKEDLVDPKMEERTTPGSRVRVLGILNEVPVPLPTGNVSTRFDLAIDANNVIPLEESYEDQKITEEDELQIKELSLDPNIFTRLSENIAPSIYGYQEVKESLVLQLFGGVRKQKLDGTVTRGDIHILLVGDPGVAKSQTLKFISKVAPKGRYVVGKSASGAGLCVSPNSMILTNPGGIEKIQNIVEERFKGEEEEYRPGIWKKDNINDVKIQSMSNDLKIHSKNPKTIWKLKSPNKVYNIKLRSGKSIELTGNTQLFSIVNGYPTWIKSMDIKEGMYIGVPRMLIGGNKILRTIDLVEDNFHVHNISDFVKECVNILCKKYGSIRKASQIIGIKEDNLYYNWVRDDPRGAPKIENIKILSDESGLTLEDKDLIVSLYNGKRHKLPAYISKDFLYLVGLIAGDGDIRKSGNDTLSIRFSNSSEELQKRFREILENEFNLPYDIQKGNLLRPSATRTHSKIIGKIINKLGVGLSPKSDKIIMSNDLLHLENDYLRYYIAGLYDSDGSVYLRKGKGSSCVDFTTTSPNLAKQLQLVLLRFGIQSSLRVRKPSINVKIIGKKEKYVLEIWNKSDIDKFYKNIPLFHKKKKENLKKIVDENKKIHSNVDVLPGIGERLKKILVKNKIALNKVSWHNNLSREGLKEILKKIKIKDEEIESLKLLSESDILWEKIVKVDIRNPDYDYVYDLTVEDSHNFVVDGVLVHNTATVVRDEFLKGWSLEAGAMVLSNKGIVCIDEIEKMDPQDRSAMHEALEQQSVTISKANVQASLRAETSVLAAGNPKFGRFDPFQAIATQIDIQPTLLNRFDVIFMLRDMPDKGKDEAIASHVLSEYKTSSHRGSIESDLFRKYIAYAKQKVNPRLTDEAISTIKNFYVGLRNAPTSSDSPLKPIPITARQLEALVRLSEASARSRLSPNVESKDAQRAVDLMKYYLLQAGFDHESKSFDIDKIVTGVTASKRGKIIEVKEVISHLESRLGKLIPLEEIEKELEGKMERKDIDEAIDKLSISGDIFTPKRGYVQRIG